MEFRLITKDPNIADMERTIQVDGTQWYLSKSLHIDLKHPELPNFACISYVWGPARKPNPIHHGELMSSNTIPALSSAMTHSKAQAFWIDALCVPPMLPVKYHTLGSMGYIYSAAEEVIITLSQDLLPVLQEMTDSDRLSEKVLLSIEKDDWVRSVWTYQEVVNAKSICFVGSPFKIDGNHFLNCLGYSLTLYRAAHEISSFDLSRQFPKLNALEELLVDWMLGGYTERSALRAMSQFQYRYNHDPKNYFYAVIGTMMKGPWPWNTEMSIEELAEEFMDVCEQKGDYSFIYASNPRNLADPKGRYWRPVAGLLQAILAWHSWGEGQKGHYNKEGFWLEKMMSLRTSSELGDSGRLFLMQWLDAIHPGSLRLSDHQIAEQILRDLRQMAFSGVDLFLWTTHGIFFLGTAVDQSADIEILVAAEVRWTFGAPGLARISRGKAIEYVPGVFVGEVLQDLVSDMLLTQVL
jgi:hypothetical protein